MAGRLGRQDPNDGITYFVPGLPVSVTEEEVTQHFQEYGTVVRVSLVSDRGKGDKRYAYVTLAETDSRERVCTDMHEFGDVSLRALLTKESLHQADVKKVHIGNLPQHIQADAIRDAFSQFGAVLDVHTPKKSVYRRAYELWLCNLWF